MSAAGRKIIVQDTTVKLSEHDRILAAYAESAAGPGWGNSPVWVIIRSSLNGAIRQECLQPKDLSPEMHTLYAVSQAAHLAMTGAAKRNLATKEPAQ